MNAEVRMVSARALVPVFAFAAIMLDVCSTTLAWAQDSGAQSVVAGAPATEPAPEPFVAPATNAASSVAQAPPSAAASAAAPATSAAANVAQAPPSAAANASAPVTIPTAHVASAPPSAAADTTPVPDADASNPELSDADESLVGDSFGSGEGGIEVGPLSIRFLAQTRYTHTWAPDSNNPRVSYREPENALVRDPDGASLHRLFMRFGVEPTEFLELKAVVDLAEFVHDNVDNAVKQGYVTLKPLPKHLELAVGLFKLPFSILELDPIANWPAADTGAADDLIKDLGFGGKDIGVELMVAPLKKAKWLRLALGTFRSHAHDEAKAVVGALGARLESQPIKGLRLGIDWVGMPEQIVYKNALETSNRELVPFPADPAYPRAITWSKGHAFSADASFHRHHLTLLVEGMLGDRVDRDFTYGAKSWAAIWALAGYRFALGGFHFMPAIRAEWLDTDVQQTVGLRRELTFALNWDVSQSVRFVLDITRTDVQADTPLWDQPKPWSQTPYLELDKTRVIGQLQCVL